MHSSFPRTTSKNDVVGALFLFVIFIGFLFIGLSRLRFAGVLRGGELDISVCRRLAGLDNTKAGLIRVTKLSLRSPRGGRLGKLELSARRFRESALGGRRWGRGRAFPSAGSRLSASARACGGLRAGSESAGTLNGNSAHGYRVT